MKFAHKMPRKNLLADHLPAFDHLDDVASWAISTCRNGFPSAPRGQPTFELFAQGFTLTKPRNRMLSLRNRNWSAALAIGEFCWHFAARDDVAPLAYYAPIWKSFSDDGEHIRGSCYGKKIFRDVDGLSPWNTALEYLRNDNDTRRAIISVGGYDGQPSSDTKDISCLQSLHFFIRNQQLHLIVHMRSNDAFIGLPYDVFFFSLLQDVMCSELDIDIGNYIHLADSLHLYERDIERASLIERRPTRSSEMSHIERLDEISSLLQFEENLRTRGISEELPSSQPWRQMAEILKKFHHSHYELR